MTLRFLPTPVEYELKFVEQKKYLRVLVTEPTMDRGAALAYLADVAMKCAENRCRLLMLERHAEVSLSEADLYLTVSDFIGMSVGTRVALVNKYFQPDDTLTQASEIARGLGGQYKCFTDTAIAEEWLLSAEPDHLGSAYKTFR